MYNVQMYSIFLSFAVIIDVLLRVFLFFCFFVFLFFCFFVFFLACLNRLNKQT